MLKVLPFGSVSAATQRLRLLAKKYPEFELMRGHDVRRFRSQQLARPENIEAARETLGHLRAATTVQNYIGPNYLAV
jgi:hypothetical protein